MIRSLEALEREAREWGSIYERDALELIARVRELEGAKAEPEKPRRLDVQPHRFGGIL